MAAKRRAPLTPRQRNARTDRSTHSHIERERRATVSHKASSDLAKESLKTEEQKKRRIHANIIARNTTKHNEIARRETASERASSTFAINEQRKQNQLELAQERADLSRRNKLTPSASSLQQDNGATAPSVSFIGGIGRSIFMAISLIVMYALVTHSDKSSKAVGNVGGIFGKFTSTQPLFVQAKAK